jgi:hypothetical protein
MKRLLILTAAVYLATAGFFWTLAVNSVTLYAVSDSYAWESFPNANNGGSNNFAITSFDANPKNMRGWIAFDIKRIPENVWIVNARLQLRIWHKTTSTEGGDTTGRVYGVYRVTQSWEEYNVTWGNQPTYTEDHHATSSVPVGQSAEWEDPPFYMYWDLTQITNDWLSGVPNYGVMVRDTNENAARQYTTQFFTHNKTPNTTFYPQLQITYVTHLSAALLIIAFVLEGLFIAAIWRIKTRSQQKLRDGS